MSARSQGADHSAACCESPSANLRRHSPATIVPLVGGLCQTVLPSAQYDPQSHKNGKSAQKPDNGRHLFKYIHRSFLLFIFDFGQRCMAAPLLITATDRPAFFVDPIQDSHTLVATSGYADRPCGGDNSVEEIWSVRGDLVGEPQTYQRARPHPSPSRVRYPKAGSFATFYHGDRASNPRLFNIHTNFDDFRLRASCFRATSNFEPRHCAGARLRPIARDPALVPPFRP